MMKKYLLYTFVFIVMCLIIGITIGLLAIRYDQQLALFTLLVGIISGYILGKTIWESNEQY